MDTTRSRRLAIVSSGGLKLDRRTVNTGRDSRHDVKQGSYWHPGDCSWSDLGHPELCDRCLLSSGLITDWNRLDDHISSMGIPYDYYSMENTEVIGVTMSDFLGTIWWSILCVAAGIAAGMWLKTWIMNKIR